MFEYITEHESFWNGCQKLLCRLNDTLLEHCGCWDAAKGLLSYLNHLDCFYKLLCGSWGVQIGCQDITMWLLRCLLFIHVNFVVLFGYYYG